MADRDQARLDVIQQFVDELVSAPSVAEWLGVPPAKSRNSGR